MAVQELTRPTKAKPKRPDRWYPPAQGKWTYSDYLQLPDNRMKYEVIKGDIYMSPAPRPKHQEIVLALIIAFYNFISDKHIGKIYHAPIDVNLPNLTSPVQPDLLFIAKDKLSIVKKRKIEGRPDLVVEVLSPGNPEHDKKTKYKAYAEAGVREYWIVDGDTCTIEVNVLRGQAYVPLGVFTADDEAFSEVLPEFKLKVSDICI